MRRWGSRGRGKRSEALLGEGAAGVGFQIFLEGERFVLIREGAVPHRFPRLEFRGVRGFAGVLLAGVQIGGDADVFMLREIDASDDVDVPHRHPCICEGKNPFCLPARLRPSGYAGHHASPLRHRVAAPREARRAKGGGARRDRTADLLHAMQALSQLSYGPVELQRLKSACGHDPEPQFRADLKSLRRRRRRQ